jgi:guanylate kinase
LSSRASLFVVSAPSGTGKTTVLTRVLALLPGVRFSVSHTTRAPRGTERDGVEYHFVERASFEELASAGRFLEWAEVHGHLYGTALAEYERASAAGADLLLDVDVQGAAQVRARFPEAVTVFLLPPSRAVLEARLRGRAADSPETVARRLEGARREVARHGEYGFVLVNQDVEECAAALITIIRAARHRTAIVSDAVRDIVHGFEV